MHKRLCEPYVVPVFAFALSASCKFQFLDPAVINHGVLCSKQFSSGYTAR